MTKFAIVRLGKDSVADIKAIDALKASPTAPLSFEVKCSQVPEELSPGDFVFVCLGSDNNNGTATEWIRGIRALGTVVAKGGGPRYNDQWQVGLEVKVVLPESVTKKDLLAAEPAAYFWASDVPVLGVDTHRVCVFVDGCFWHGCSKCYRAPTSNVEYWTSKVERNRERDKDVSKTLRSKGWRVLRLWEHELARANRANLLRRLRRWLTPKHSLG